MAPESGRVQTLIGLVPSPLLVVLWWITVFSHRFSPHLDAVCAVEVDLGRRYRMFAICLFDKCFHLGDQYRPQFQGASWSALAMFTMPFSAPGRFESVPGIRPVAWLSVLPGSS